MKSGCHAVPDQFLDACHIPKSAWFLAAFRAALPVASSRVLLLSP
jgi:hypothetical protein